MKEKPNLYLPEFCLSGTNCMGFFSLVNGGWTETTLKCPAAFGCRPRRHVVSKASFENLPYEVRWIIVVCCSSPLGHTNSHC